MSRTWCAPLLLCLALASGVPSAAKPADLANRHLSARMDEETGRIFLATGGEPGRDLLFRDRPPSSFTVLRIGGDLAVFGGEGGRFVARPEVVGGRIRAEWETGGVRAVQTFSLAARKGSGTRDGLLITLTLENRTGASRQVGARIIFDTVLGEKRGAHFRLSDGREIRAETVLQGDRLPAAWVSADPGGGACLQGLLAGGPVTPPARVVFANYRRMSRAREYEPSPGRSFHDPPYSRNDSAVALYFGPDTLPPGGRVSYRTILGLCGLEEYAGEEEAPALPESEDAGAPAAPEAAVGELDALPPETAAAGVGPDPGQARKVRRELRRLGRIAESLEELNRLLEEINRLLAGEGAEITPEQVKELADRLDQAR